MKDLPSAHTSTTWRQLKHGGIGFIAGVAFLSLLMYGMQLHWSVSPLLPAKAKLAPGTHSRQTESTERVKAQTNITSTPRVEPHHVIMCMIFTTPGEWMAKALAVRNTWAKRCDFHKFFYSKTAGPRLEGAYALDVPEGRHHLTKKTMAALKISFNFYKDNVDWYVKADDDTYIIMENLRHILYQYDPTKPHYLGHRSMDYVEHGYNGGGASYSLSHQAALQVVQNGSKCVQDTGVEDLDMGKCLAEFHIYPVDLRDEKKRLRFHPDHPIMVLSGVQANTYKYETGNVTFGNHKGIPVMSPSMVSFHYVKPEYMYMYDFLLYDLERPLLHTLKGQG